MKLTMQISMATSETTHDATHILLLEKKKPIAAPITERIKPEMMNTIANAPKIFAASAIRQNASPNTDSAIETMLIMRLATGKILFMC